MYIGAVAVLPTYVLSSSDGIAAVDGLPALT